MYLFTDADESRHFHSHSSIESDFVPIIPSQVDPHPILSLHSDPQLDPIDYFSSFYRSRHYQHQQVSTSRPFALRHINSPPQQQQHHLYVSSTRAPSSSSTASPSFDPAILGSGDFTVMRGGTFYPEGDGDDDRRQDYYGSSFFDSNTGRPFALPLERPNRPQHFSNDPFRHFRDFADIAGVDSDFTNLVVVYANKNSTPKHEPRNILEQLELLDQQKESETNKNKNNDDDDRETEIKSTKLSKFKTKLSSSTKMKTQQKQSKEFYKKVQTPKKSTQSVDYVDPLLADS